MDFSALKPSEDMRVGDLLVGTGGRVWRVIGVAKEPSVLLAEVGGTGESTLLNLPDTHADWAGLKRFWRKMLLS